MSSERGRRGHRAGGVAIALAAIDAVSGLPDEHAKVCFDLIRESLDAAAGRALENEMQHGKYEYKRDFARRYFGEGPHRPRRARPAGAPQGRARAARR